MQIAFISDIHGNLLSLELVLTKIQRESPDSIICLGDTAAMGPNPNEVLDRLRDLNCLCILGNHDEELIGDELKLDPNTPTPIVEWIRFCADSLTPRNKEFLRTFSASFQIDLGMAGKLLCCHGSHRSNMEPIFPSISEESLDEILADVPTRWIAFGHTHLQTYRRHKNYTLFNPGSIGAPLEMLPFTGNAVYMPWAEYAILSVKDKGIEIKFHRVHVDIDEIIQSVKSTSLPQPDVWIDSWLQGQRKNIEVLGGQI